MSTEASTELPPVGALLGMRPVEFGDGFVALDLDPAECHYSTGPAVHGGVLATLLDSAMSLALHSQLPAMTFASTLDLKVSYLRPVTVDTGTVHGEGKVLHKGRRVALTEGQVVDANGKLLAHATSTCLIRSAGT
ncbi:MAG TPA: PaaI family thioesterase [Thermoleophilaceae bacterium]|nr:PaaI family thioesterase [Thermoleophilaceae bacterium]